ncbi:MAG: 16S rRNA (cytosine(1402)-N(4))-methyltransferase RsmH [Beijerinckiaceae bacterium]|nr:16S rRNA (cytosine(1402)-N(4))-methyltransferase RsmH [Beijerinckiaceae bacterium]
MPGRGNEAHLAAGGPARHVPVLRDEVMAVLALRGGGLYLDATFGAGGYTSALLEQSNTRVLALDRDPIAIAGGAALVSEARGRLSLVKERFGRLGHAAREAGLSEFDGVVLDLGVSSMQLGDAGRGFSFQADGPLDMRMDCEGPSAADLVNKAEESTLAGIFYYFGEERASRRIARAIVQDRLLAPITSTGALARLIARVAPGKPGGVHPATRAFQALRIAVNDELGELVEALAAAEAVLKCCGCLAVVTFHSLEDRIVKQFFVARSGRGQTASRLLPHETAPLEPTFTLKGKQPLLPSRREIAANPRARSAKLRYGMRTGAAARGADARLMALARLPQAHAGGH